MKTDGPQPTMTLTKDAYQEEVAQQAEYLYETVDTDEPPHLQRRDVLESVSDSLYGHDWFVRTDNGPATYGAIVEHSDTEPGDNHDISTLLDVDNVAYAFKRVAYRAFEGDVTRETMELVNGGLNER